jgi:soluble lytic murein transglycosylase-like protein
MTALRAETPAEAARAKMLAALDQQRESVRKQARALKLFDQEAPDFPPDFYVTPWPKQSPGGGVAAAQPVAYRFPVAPCGPVEPIRLAEMIGETARREGVDERLLRAVVRKESAGVPCAVSPVGALGLMQLMPATASSVGVRDPFEPKQNLEGGARLLRQLLERYGGNIALALGAYNAGPASVDQYQGVPPFAETRNYVTEILKSLRVD